MAGDEDLGRRLRQLRTTASLSLSDAAQRAGVTASFLSQLERGLAAPSVATLLRLAEVLDVSIGDLFPPPTSSRVVQAVDRRTVRFQGLTEGLITTPDARILGAAICTLGPQCDSGQIEHRSLEELLFVLSGQLEVRFEQETVVLSEGSAFTYDCRIPHVLANPQADDCVVLMCHAPRPTSSAPLKDQQAFADFLYRERSEPRRTDQPAHVGARSSRSVRE